MTKYKGQACWLPGDIITRLYKDRDPQDSIQDILRDLLEIPPPGLGSPIVKPRSKYDVSDLNIGESKMFAVGKPMRYIVDRINNNSANRGKRFEVKATFSGTQVTRIL